MSRALSRPLSSGPHKTKTYRRIVVILGMTACLLLAESVFARQTPKVPTVNADVGGCTADFTVENGNHKPLYDAKVSVKFRYGFLNLHKASLEAFTNSKGKARFEGLPDAPKKPLEFRILYGNRQKTVTDNPGNVCNEDFTVVLP
jgi:hypothetical protein